MLVSASSTKLGVNHASFTFTTAIEYLLLEELANFFQLLSFFFFLSRNDGLEELKDKKTRDFEAKKCAEEKSQVYHLQASQSYPNQTEHQAKKKQINRTSFDYFEKIG